MLYLGQSITNASDLLQPISSEQVYLRIREPQPSVVNQIINLRTIRTIDTKRYAELKRQLPYLVCGTFNPSFRRTENFAYIDSFILDIDHILQKGFTVDNLRHRLQQDERVELCFLSPSEDGLKLLFQLEEKCYDYGMFSLFYKAFAKNFSMQYGLEQVIDSRTSDVTRACFLSYDSNAYFNPIPLSIRMGDFLELDSPQALFDMKKELDEAVPLPQCQQSQEEGCSKDPDKDAILHIKEILELRKTKKEKALVYVPEPLNQMKDGLQAFLAEVDMQISNIRDIQYGKQIHVSLRNKQAECNVFFGKKGFRVVQSPKTGTNQELNQLLQELIQMYLDSK